MNNTIPEQDCVIDNKNAGTQDRWKDRIHFLPDKAENGFLCLNSYSFNSIIIEHYVKEVGISYDYLEPEEDNTFKIILAAIAGTGIVGVGIAIFLTLRR